MGVLISRDTPSQGAPRAASGNLVVGPQDQQGTQQQDGLDRRQSGAQHPIVSHYDRNQADPQTIGVPGLDGNDGESSGYEEETAVIPGKQFVSTMMQFEVGETIGDKYEVREVMPCGCIGRTYRARSVAHDSDCVFKVVCFVSREPHLEAVRDDQKVLTRLQHANVLPVYDVMEDPGHENMIVVTAYVPNRNVAKYQGLLLQAAATPQQRSNLLHADSTSGSSSPMSNSDAAERLRCMVRDIGIGLRVLHSHHVYHLDLKLENVLESKDGCCIADAGYSKLFSAVGADALVQLYDPAVLPPEVFSVDCDRLDEHTASKIDVWSFGMCIYRLAFGHYPIDIGEHMTRDEVVHAVKTFKLKESLHFTSHRSNSDLWEVIAWCLEKDPKDRPSIMRLLRHSYFRVAQGQSFVEAGGGTSSVAANSVVNVHRSITDQHTGFVVSVVLGKGPHSESFLVHLPSRPTKLFVLKSFLTSISSRLGSCSAEKQLEVRKQLAISRRIRHRNVAHVYEIVDNAGCSYVTQKFFPRGNLAINYLPLDREGICVSLMLADVLRGLACLHDVGVLHLNLKLSNIFYADDDCFVVSDFGPMFVYPAQIFDVATGIGSVGIPPHVRAALDEGHASALQYIDTFCVGLVAVSALPDLRAVVWDVYYNNITVDVDKVISKLNQRYQQNAHVFPPKFVEFVTEALTTCRTAKELLQHPFLSKELKPDDLQQFYFDVHSDDITSVIRDKFVCRDENRLADLLGHGGFLIDSPQAHTLGHCGSCASMANAERRESQADDVMSVSQMPTTPPNNNNNVTSGALSQSNNNAADDQRVHYAYTDKITCGLCHKELKLVIYRCSECADYIRCGKCASVDSHGHTLDPLVIENVAHQDADDEILVAKLAPPSAFNKHALEELEMQADLPAGTLSRTAQPHFRSFRKKEGSLARGDSFGRVSPSHPEAEGETSPYKSTASEKGSGAEPKKKELLKEGDAMDDTTPETEIELCRQNNERELMLHNFGLTVVPAPLFDPPLAHVVHLNLANNALAELPHDIGYLNSLQKLSLANNKLTTLPDSIGDLAELLYLDVSHNLLTDLPPSLMFADKLDTIAMDYNNCAEIPGVILDMPQMRFVYLAENRRISKWPPLAQLQSIGPIKFGLDNEPLLWGEYHSFKDSIPRVTVMWNKIYPDEIIPHLFCGSLRSAQSLAVYDRLNITYLLTVGRGLEPTVIDGMVHKTVIVDDIDGAVIDHSFGEAVAFIDEALQKGLGCLVHCFAGMSRSATTVIAYLMMKRGMRLDEAYCTTRRGRPAIYPNAGFFRQLLAMDKQLYPGQRPLDMPSMERHIIPSA